MIAWTIYITFAGAVLLLIMPRVFSRWIALATTAAGLVTSAIALFQISIVDLATFKTIVRVPWVPMLGMNYHLAVDGVSVTMVLVTGICAVSTVLFSWDVDLRQNEFFFWLLLVVGGSYGVFLSADLFLLFVFYELVIFPKYFLIAIWGSTNKEYGAMKLTLYSFVGGALVFVGIIAAYVTAGSLDLQQLAQFQFTPQLQCWAFPVLFIGFAVLAGIWPLHTWAPTGHVAAPTAGSMLLAGIVMKLGSYAGLRVAMNLFPEGFQMWRVWIAVLAVIGIVYAAGVALRQRDLKFVIGYSSVSHMGFVLFGFATANVLGVSGAVLQMFSHGVIGAWKAYPLAVWITGTGMVLVAAFTLRALKQSFFGEVSAIALGGSTAPSGGAKQFSASPTLLTSSAERSTHLPENLGPITIAEKCGACLFMFATLAIGLYPKLLLDRIMPAVEAMRFLK